MPRISRLTKIKRQAARAAILEAIARHGTKTAAAEALGISRQSLDEQLKAR